MHQQSSEKYEIPIMQKMRCSQMAKSQKKSQTRTDLTVIEFKHERLQAYNL